MAEKPDSGKTDVEVKYAAPQSPDFEMLPAYRILSTSFVQNKGHRDSSQDNTKLGFRARGFRSPPPDFPLPELAVDPTCIDITTTKMEWIVATSLAND